MDCHRHTRGDAARTTLCTHEVGCCCCWQHGYIGARAYGCAKAAAVFIPFPNATCSRITCYGKCCGCCNTHRRLRSYNRQRTTSEGLHGNCNRAAICGVTNTLSAHKITIGSISRDGDTRACANKRTTASAAVPLPLCTCAERTALHCQCNLSAR